MSAFSQAVHLFNTLPSPVLAHKTPYEKFFKARPDYSQLKVFGSAYFPYLRPFQQHKLQFWSQRCVFLGLSSNQKGYRCQAPDGRVYISRHVVFNEMLFPFQNGFTLSKTDTSVRFCHQQNAIPVVGSTGQSVSRPWCAYPAPPDSMHVHSSGSRQSSSSSLVPNSLDSATNSPTHCTPDPSSQVSPPVAQVVPPINRHPMCTRSKNGMFKPRVFSTV